MPIDNVVSTLPDRKYIAALEKHIQNQDALIARLLLDVRNLQRGR